MLSEEEKKDLEYIKESPTSREIMLLRIISKQQSDIEIKDKVIDLMAEKLVEDSDIFNYQHSMTEEKWKQYFYKKVEEENE